MTIGFIGFGNMAQAIARGIDANRQMLDAQMIAYNPTRAKIENFSGNVLPCDTPIEVARKSEYLFLCIKPQMLSQAAPAFREGIGGPTVVISILAGVTVEMLAERLNTTRPILRAMPNTPLLLGAGTTAIARPQGISDRQFEVVTNIFGAIGSVYEIPEDRFDEVIPVNGSSPALIYLLAKLVAENARKNGLDFQQALEMFSDTLSGSAQMIRRSGRNIDELIEMVCSKGGTTLAMLDRLREQGFEQILDQALDRCVQRAKELGQGGSAPGKAQK